MKRLNRRRGGDAGTFDDVTLCLKEFKIGKTIAPACAILL
jgi:hypothetical protein